MKLTKQGVRNLDTLAGKGVGRKLDMPPVNQLCSHPEVQEFHYCGVMFHKCLTCGECWDLDYNW